MKSTVRSSPDSMMHLHHFLSLGNRSGVSIFHQETHYFDQETASPYPTRIVRFNCSPL
jgi:hypothetical protein